MKLKVRNLGAIKEGTVDLSQKFIVFCGPNGTGKTYLSYVIYGLLKRKLHIQGKQKFAEKLINERKTSLEIDFDKLFQYRKQMLSSTQASVDELFGIGEAESRKIFKDFQCEFPVNDEEFKEKLLAAKIESIDKIQGVQIKMEKEPGKSQLLTHTSIIFWQHTPSAMLKCSRLSETPSIHLAKNYLSESKKL